MAYPSTYGSGIIDCPDRCVPAPRHSYEIVYYTVRHALTRAFAVKPGIRVLPWLQAFGDYLFSLPFGREEYWQQQRGASAAGAAGVYFWEPAGVYPDDIFLPPPPPSKLRAMVR